MRIKDHDIDFVQEILIHVQIDRYMDLYGTMYLIIENPYIKDKWGIIRTTKKGKKPMDESEKPPRVDSRNYLLVNYIRVKRVQVDDPNVGLY